MKPIYIIIIIFAALSLFFFFVAYLEKKRQEHEIREADKKLYAPDQKSSTAIQKPSPLVYAQIRSAKHVYGLPCPEDTSVNIEAYKTRVSFSANNISYDLAYNKIIDACVKTDVEIRSQTTSSAGGAVAGAMLFGPLGAAIGGRTKTTNTYDFNYYLIFTYTDKTGNIAYMGFQVLRESDAKKFLSSIEPCIPKQKKNIEL